MSVIVDIFVLVLCLAYYRFFNRKVEEKKHTKIDIIFFTFVVAWLLFKISSYLSPGPTVYKMDYTKVNK